MKVYLPALIFLLVASIGIGGVFLWQRRFSSRARAVARQIAGAIALRKANADQDLRQVAAEQSDFLNWLDQKLDGFTALKLLLIRADTGKDSAQFVLMSAAFLLGGAILAPVVFGMGIFGTFLTALLCSLMPWWFVSNQAKKRRLKFEDQLPEALDFIARSLRAGHGLTAALGMAGNELPEPVGPELKITFDEINFGIPFQEAMTNLMARINSPDLAFFTVAVVLQRETGGNLNELLANLAKLIRERIKLKGKVRVLSSEGKFSGILLGAMPFILGGVLTVVNPEYMSMLWSTPQGHNLILTGLVMLLLGAFFMHRIVQIKV